MKLSVFVAFESTMLAIVHAKPLVSMVLLLGSEVRDEMQRVGNGVLLHIWCIKSSLH